MVDGRDSTACGPGGSVPPMARTVAMVFGPARGVLGSLRGTPVPP